MAKLLVQSRGSPSDPEYDEQIVHGLTFTELMQRCGIRTLTTDLINSAHGCPDLTLKHARQIQRLADIGHRVAVADAGGLLWVKPGFEAANMPTVPIVSISLGDGWYRGVSAFLAPMVPSGIAAVGGVGMNGYETAACVLDRILNKNFGGVYVYNPSEKLTAKLGELGVDVLGRVNGDELYSLEDCLVVGCLDSLDSEGISRFEGINPEGLGIFTPPQSDSFGDVEKLMDLTSRMKHSVWVRGAENAAFYAAKVVSAYNSRARDALRDLAEKKRESYDARNITPSSFVGGRL